LPIEGFHDIKGQRFFKWIVIGPFEVIRRPNVKFHRWLCRCECGGEFYVRQALLLYGGSRSCMSCAKRKHGRSHSAEYRIWDGMRRRCHNVLDNGYPRYGGRGIVVCERWRKSFPDFLSDMGLRPGPGYTLDRINNEGDYEPGNVRWATSREQAQNRSDNVFLEYEGARHCLAEWSRLVSIRPTTLGMRIAAGMSPEMALYKSPRKYWDGVSP